jgi:hypothetical protein
MSFFNSISNIISYLLTALYLALTGASSYLIVKKNHPMHYWFGPVILIVLIIISLSYHIPKQKETDPKQKAINNETYFHIVMVPVYIVLLGVLFILFKESPFLPFLILK